MRSRTALEHPSRARRLTQAAAVVAALVALQVPGVPASSSADDAQGAPPGGLAGLAAPGPCAEAPQVRAEPELEFDVAGGPREHFDAQDVGATGGDPSFEPPSAPSIRRGPCEGPAAGDCGGGVGVRSGGAVINEPMPDPDDGPVFGGGGGVP